MRIFYLTWVSVLTSSCLFNNSTCNKLSLSKDEQNWFINYKNGELRLYKNQFGDIDTFTVAVETNQTYTICNRFELGEYQYGSQVVSFKAKECHGMDDFYCDFTIRFTKEFQDNSNRKCKKQFSFFDLRSEDIIDLEKIKVVYDTLHHTNKKIDSYRFEHVISAKDANSGYCFFESFDVNKEFGLVRYENKKGEIYEYWKKIRNPLKTTP